MEIFDTIQNRLPAHVGFSEEQIEYLGELVTINPYNWFDILVTRNKYMGTPSDELVKNIIIDASGKLEAVKSVKLLSGFSLVDSKALVDSLWPLYR